ncbi:MAG: AAA family ATPase [Clostridia bacterium]|jgi:MinD-like ATPase involved in chromosome partitioning or flagellar assembly|nr:AAA family ATPase [Clostridia bacterium]MCI9412997.1 AAA family ATPase [Clostridia bacterium]
MKKIMTAIGDQNLNHKLKQENTFEIVVEDISYKEGIIEVLEKKQIDFLILSELLPGEIGIKELIEKIKEISSSIQIILFLEKKNQELENYLYAKGIYYIFYDNQVEISKMIEIIKEEPNENKQLKKELEELKQLVIEKGSNQEKIREFLQRKNEKIRNKRRLAIEEAKKEGTSSEERQHEIICVSGVSGVGKSIFSVNLAKVFMENKNKILIIDFDVLNNSLHTILGIKKYPEKVASKIKNNNLLKPLQIEELIMKINSKVDLIAGISLLFDGQYQISKVKIKTILSKLKEKYDAIIIDTSSECFLDYTKEIMKNSNVNIFMVEPNLLEIKKAKKLLNIYINQWGIPQSDFHILFNKYNENSIDSSILKNIFSGFSILGKLSNSSQYNLLIDKNDTKCLKKDLQKEYLNIFQRLLKSESLERKIGRNLWKKF